MLRSQPRKVAVAAAALSAALLAGCSGGGSGDSPSASASSDTPVPGGSITAGGLVAGPIDPGQATFSTQYRPWALPIFGSLFYPKGSKGSDYAPGLASGYKYSADKLTLTVTLRPKLVYSDGSPLNADSLVWNLNRHIQNNTREKQFFQYVTGIKKVDDLNAAITFSQPQTLLLDAMANSSTGFMTSEATFDKVGPEAFSVTPVGAGPFKIDKATSGQEIDMSKNTSYYDAKHVYLDKLTWLNTGTNAQGWLTNLQSGTIQAIQMNGNNTSATVLDSIKGDPSLQLSHGLSTYVAIIPTNTFKAPFNDLKARQAIAYCMDREAIANSVLKGYAKPAFVLSGDSSALKDWQEGKKLNPLQHDVKKGTALVKELGGLSFTITTNETAPTITALQQQWSECGIKAQVDVTPAYLTEVKEGSYQMSYTTNTNGGLNPAASTNYLDPDSANNKFGWRDESIWQQINATKGMTDQAQATAQWHKIWKSLDENGFIIPVVSAPNYVGASSKLHGIEQTVTMDLTHAWLAK